MNSMSVETVRCERTATGKKSTQCTSGYRQPRTLSSGFTRQIIAAKHGEAI